MISPAYYHKDNTAKLYLGGKIAHYMRKDLTKTLEEYTHDVTESENMYTLALKLFGENSMYFWTVIADNNRLKQPDDWQPGDIVKLPSIVLNDIIPPLPIYEPARYNTTVF